MQKVLLGIALTAAFGALLSALVDARGENARLRADLSDQQRMLREQIETEGQSRADLDRRSADLRRDLTTARNQLDVLSGELANTREMISPDYERLLQRAREEVASEQRASGAAAASRALRVDPQSARAEAVARVPELYGGFMAELGLDADGREQVLAALVDWEAMRSQSRADLLDGNLTPRQALNLFGADALNRSLANLLDESQLAELRQYSDFLKRDSARLIYGETLSRMGTALSGEAQELALETLLDELYSEANHHGALVGPDGSMKTAYDSQLAAYDRAREQLLSELEPEQMDQFNRFIDSRRGGVDLVLEATVDEVGGLRLRNERAALENLPN